jgi:hypothetical protein
MMMCQGFRGMNMRGGNREVQMCFRRQSAARCIRGAEDGLSLRFVVLIDRVVGEVARRQSRSIGRAAVGQIESALY